MNFFNVILLGQTGVGKTSIIRRIDQDVFIEGQATRSLEMEFILHSVHTRSGEAKFRIWDTGDMERYTSNLPSSLYRNKQAALFVYSLTKKESLRDIDNWFKTFKAYYSADSLPPCILLANKTDDHIHSECTVNDGLSMYGIDTFGTSALQGTGINEVFKYLAHKMVNLDHKFVPSGGLNNEDTFEDSVGSAVDTPFKFVRIMRSCSLL